MGSSQLLNLAAVVAAIAGLSAIVIENLPADGNYQLVNVSYDPTRELYETINPLFVAAYEKETGRHLVIVQSHGGSSRQARKVVDGELAEEVREMISYSRHALQRDVVAALTVAAVSLPQSMAYALLAGVDPRYGLYSAILVTAVASVFGSSSHLINGPTSAISLVVFSALSIFDADQRIEGRSDVFAGGDGRRSPDRDCRSSSR